MLPQENHTARERSIAAAFEVVRADGLNGLTTRAIARRSGLTQPAIYRHFDGVDELVGETLAVIRSVFVERLESAGSEGATARERLTNSLNAFRDFAIEEPRLYEALFLHVGGGLAPRGSGDRSRGQNIFAFIVERVTDCARDGSIRESGPVSSALSVVAFAQGLVLLYRQGRFGSKERFSEAFSRSMDDLLRGLLPGSPGVEPVARP